ncbi:MAG: hypothetical protein RI894_586 [Bacteroidota bacterium]|jgi:hypothetical protein
MVPFYKRRSHFFYAITRIFSVFVAKSLLIFELAPKAILLYDTKVGLIVFSIKYKIVLL